MTARITARYWLETPDDPQRAAAIIAGEQSSGTFLALANETDELKLRAGARVERLDIFEVVSTPSLPGRYASQRFTRCELTLSWPLENIGASLPNLLATIAGNLFELQCVSGLRILDINLPVEFGQRYAGPAFGITGTRKLSGVAKGPLIGTIIKPSIGMSAAQTAQEVRQLIAAGVDFIKDDELQSDAVHCPFEERARLVMHEINAAAQRDGRKVMFAFNITGDLDQMKARHDLVHALGGTCVMASVNSVGLVGMTALRRHSVLPIHAHRNGWGYLTRSPALGWTFSAWQKLWRIAGADHLHVNGIENKFSESNESVIASARAMLAPLFADFPCEAMPVFSSGQTGLQAAPTFAALQSSDLIFAAGGGIFGHPRGIVAGVTAMRQAWDAAMRGEPITDAARVHPELRDALSFWK